MHCGTRLFQTHTVRPVVPLSGTWHMKAKNRFECDTAVPSVWERYPQLSTYKGTVVYSKTVETPKTRLRFYFEGVSFFATVRLDGKIIGKHYNAFTPFACTTDVVEAGKHLLEVEVNNRYGFRSALHVPNDYYSYGGIIRDCQMEYIADSYIDAVGLVPFRTEKGWGLSCEIRGEGQGEIFALCDGKNFPLGRLNAFPEKRIFYLEGVRAWSPENPVLYEVRFELRQGDTAVDDLVERTGFRTVETRVDGVYVNGKKYFLKGVNRHESYGTSGSAVPLEGMQKDLALLKELGVNAIRTSHYPNSSLFLDACDEMGFLVWEETHTRGFDVKKMYHPLFEKQLFDCGEEMMKWHIGHPSIVIWGCLNECSDTTRLGRRIYKKHIAQLKSLDASRPVTFASCRPFTSRCFDLADVVSLNLYYGWQDERKPCDMFPQVYARIREAGGRGKPVLISEFGASGLYGFHSDVPEEWSEEYQAKVLRENARYYMSVPEIVGVFVWQFCDCRIDPIEFYHRVGGKCNKGLVSDRREKKAAFYAVQEVYTQEKRNEKDD